MTDEEKRRKAAFEKRKWRPGVIVFVSLFIVLIAAAAIWQKSWDPKPAPVVVEPQLTPDVQPEKITSVRGLDNLIASLEVKYETAPTPGRVEILNQMFQCGKRMVEVADTDADRRIGRKKMMHALVVLATLKWAQKIEPGETREQLRVVSEEFRNSSDIDVVTDVYIASILIAGFDLLDQPTSNERAAAFNKAIGESVAKFPAEYQIILTIETILDWFQLKNEDWIALQEIVDFIRSAYQGSSDPLIRRRVESLPDRLVFHRHQLDRILVNCEANVETAFDDLLTRIPKILDEKLSISGLGRLISIGSVFERMGRYSHARQLYTLLLAKTVAAASADEIKVLRMGCENGIKRLDLIGQKLILDAQDAFGKTLTPSGFLGHPTAVLFIANQNEVLEAKNMMAELRGLGRQGIMVVVVCLDMDSKTAVSKFSESELKRISLVADLKRAGTIFRQCPVEMTPYAVVLDKNSVVEKIAVPMMHIETELEGLVFGK